MRIQTQVYVPTEDGGNELNKIFIELPKNLAFYGRSELTSVLRIFFFLCFVSLFLCRETKKKEIKEKPESRTTNIRYALDL